MSRFGRARQWRAHGCAVNSRALGRLSLTDASPNQVPTIEHREPLVLVIFAVMKTRSPAKKRFTCRNRNFNLRMSPQRIGESLRTVSVGCRRVSLRNWGGVLKRMLSLLSRNGIEMPLDEQLSPTQFVAAAHREVMADRAPSRLCARVRKVQRWQEQQHIQAHCPLS